MTQKRVQFVFGGRDGAGTRFSFSPTWIQTAALQFGIFRVCLSIERPPVPLPVYLMSFCVWVKLFGGT